MPPYSYKCRKCDHRFKEMILPLHDYGPELHKRFKPMEAGVTTEICIVSAGTELKERGEGAAPPPPFLRVTIRRFDR